jgi:hypothetical protein
MTEKKGNQHKQYTFAGKTGDKHFWAHELNLATWRSFIGRVRHWKADATNFPYEKIFSPATRTLHRDIPSKLLNYTEDANGCWIWRGNTTSDGYGRIRIGKQKRRAHIASYELTHGAVPENKMICHKCGNSLCIKPEHLYAGTAKENYADMVRHGRSNRPSGEAHPKAKLTEEKVRAIRESSKTTRVLANIYGIGKSTVQQIKAREIWKKCR